MRYPIALSLSVLCTVSVLAAQTPPQPAAPAQPAQEQSRPASPASQAADATKVTYTGCLKPGTAADSWTLENAEIASAAGIAAKAPAATGTSGTASSKTTFGLTVKPDQNLKPHANHKIEVVGTVSPKAGAAAPAAPSAASATTPQQNLTVESFKMVSATCP
jgi:hypothetical protein